MENEIWKEVTDWEIYEVSNLGRIRNKRTGWIKIARQNNRGYELVQFDDGKRIKTNLVHRVVAREFCECLNGNNVVNHIDGNPLNNLAENLEWCTQKHNVNEAIRMGRFNPVESQKKAVISRNKKRWIQI